MWEILILRREILKKKKMLTTLGIFNIFKILKIREDSFVALLILRHVLYAN